MDEVVRAFLEKEQHLRLGRRLGRGGFAEVYEATTPQGVRCAIKVSLDPLDGQNSEVQKELKNLDLIKTLTGHPNIVTLMDYWLVAGYLVTRWELASDGSLLDCLRRWQQEGHQGIPLGHLLRFCADAAEAIDFMNRQRGIYHRDIKPQNLLLFHGRVKVGDLGLAKFVGASTASHTGSGTLGYLPPEAYDVRRLVPTVDLYGLAATYVKLRTGREPFGETPMEMFERQRAGRPVLDGLRPEEAELVRQALAPRPEDRPQDGAVAWVRSMDGALRGRGRSGAGGSPKRPAAGASQATSLEQRPERRAMAAQPAAVVGESTPSAPAVARASLVLGSFPGGGTTGGSSKAANNRTRKPNVIVGAIIGAIYMGIRRGFYVGSRWSIQLGIIWGIEAAIATYVGIDQATTRGIWEAILAPITGAAICGAILGAIWGAVAVVVFGAIQGAKGRHLDEPIGQDIADFIAWSIGSVVGGAIGMAVMGLFAGVAAAIILGVCGAIWGAINGAIAVAIFGGIQRAKRRSLHQPIEGRVGVRIAFAISPGIAWVIGMAIIGAMYGGIKGAIIGAIAGAIGQAIGGKIAGAIVGNRTE